MINFHSNKNSSNVRKFAKFLFIFNTLAFFALLAFCIYSGYNLFTNPEGIGEFFGRISKGFQEAK